MDTFLIFASIYPSVFIKLVPIYALIAEGYMNTCWKKLILTCFGGYAVKSGKKELADSLLFILDKIDRNNTILIYPEGKVIRAGELPKAHPGIGYLALKRNIQLVPVYLSGFTNVNIKKLLLRGYKVKVVFGEILNFYNKKQLKPKVVSASILNYIYTLSK